MLKKYFNLIMLFFGIILPAFCVAEINGKAQELEWPDLIPKGFNPDTIFEEYLEKYDIDQLRDDDPKVKELMGILDKLQKDAPVNNLLNGKLVKLPGYVLPLESDGQKTTEFLLVPYFGACIHVPPPPANQTVYVKMQDNKGAIIRKLYDTVWVTGVIHIEKLATDLADTGYTLKAIKVEPYE